MSHLTIGIIGALLILLSATTSSAKAWRGITPLKSTRADVERLFGKPNELGRYEIENDRAYIFYSEGQCTGHYRNLAEETCECLVAKDTVLRIAVTLKKWIQSKEIGKPNYKRTILSSNPATSTYTDLDDGVVYTVHNPDGLLTAIDYWPSTADCREVMTQVRTANVQRNVWSSIRPLFSTRDDVERILGRLKRRSLSQSYVYETNEEKVDVLYSDGPCTPSVVGKWNVPSNTVLSITIYPQRTVLISDLQLNGNKYERVPDPNIPNWFFWLNREYGVMIQSEVEISVERVMSITYSRSTQDNRLLCK
jgi:hypothetical protein